jgi:3-deoxy-D-manno-octulosonate 8-phosphate phosphatase (KDO 8-P phosphatase)
LVVLDVDGVLTDGRVVYAGEEEVQHFHVHDGAAIVWLLRAGIEVAWITGRGSKATQARAKELGVKELHLHALPKERALAGLQARLAILPEHTLSMGDDLADFGLFALSAVRVAPSNARAEVRERADFVTLAAGGQGAVREMAERVLRARGAWDDLVASARASER